MEKTLTCFSSEKPSFPSPFPLLFPVAPSGAAGGCFAKPPIWRSSWLRRCSGRPWLVGAARPHASPNATALAPSCLLAVRGAFGLGGFCWGVVASSSQPLQNPPCPFRFPWLCRERCTPAFADIESPCGDTIYSQVLPSVRTFAVTYGASNSAPCLSSAKPLESVTPNPPSGQRVSTNSPLPLTMQLLSPSLWGSFPPVEFAVVTRGYPAPPHSSTDGYRIARRCCAHLYVKRRPSLRLRHMAELCRHSRVPLPARFRRAGPQLPTFPAPRHPCGWQIGGALRADISSAPPPYSWAALGLPPSLRRSALPSAASRRLQAGSQGAQGASADVLLFRHGRLVILPAATSCMLPNHVAAFLPLATRACSPHGSIAGRVPAARSPPCLRAPDVPSLPPASILHAPPTVAADVAPNGAVPLAIARGTAAQIYDGSRGARRLLSRVSRWNRCRYGIPAPSPRVTRFQREPSRRHQPSSLECYSPSGRQHLSFSSLRSPAHHPMRCLWWLRPHAPRHRKRMAFATLFHAYFWCIGIYFSIPISRYSSLSNATGKNPKSVQLLCILSYIIITEVKLCYCVSAIFLLKCKTLFFPDASSPLPLRFLSVSCPFQK